MKTLFTLLAFVAGTILFASCGNQSATNQDTDSTATTTNTSTMTKQIKTEDFNFTADSVNSKSFVAYDAAKKDKAPIILVVPEWWGLNDYARGRAKQLADLGYFAVAVDLFGDDKIAKSPDEAKAFTASYYGNPAKGNILLAAALAKAKTYAQADTSKTAIIGYCFGGSMALNAARSGMNLTGVVSFHGGLKTGVLPIKGMKAQVLVCHGGADVFVPAADVDAFKKQMDSVGATYTFKVYDSATHAFTNPEADENGKKFSMPIKYNPAADKASWQDMKDFFAKIF